MVQSPTAEEFTALLEALTVATQRGDEAGLQSRSLAGELRVVRAERDLLEERLNKFMRQIFAAKSEVSGLHQKDMFFNEAEVLGAAAQPAQEELDGEDEKAIAVPGHKRARRGRKPLDPALPREVVRHELAQAERVCPHDGTALQEIGVEASEQLDIIPQQVRVTRHERVKYACPCCDGALYPRITQLDFTGPHEVLSRLPGAHCVLASSEGGSVVADGGLSFDTQRLSDVTECALLCVPGGYGTVAAMEDAAFLHELHRLASKAQFVTSVCTGSLLLAAAGLLRGKRAACHWADPTWPALLSWRRRSSG